MRDTSELVLVSSSPPAAPELRLCALATVRDWSREQLRLHLTAALPLATSGEIEALVRAVEAEAREAEG